MQELESRLKTLTEAKISLQDQVDKLKPEVKRQEERIQSLQMDVQARKDEIGRLIVENTALLGQLDAEKATLGENKARILSLREDHEKVLSEKADLGAKQVVECLLCTSYMPACICCLQAYTCAGMSTCIKHARTNACTHTLSLMRRRRLLRLNIGTSRPI